MHKKRIVCAMDATTIYQVLNNTHPLSTASMLDIIIIATSMAARKLLIQFIANRSNF